MRILRRISEDDMVAAFLAGELGSGRFRPLIDKELAAIGCDVNLITDPDLADERQNELRRLVLRYRGYREDRELFAGFPDDVEWYKVVLTPDDLAKAWYIDYEFWNDLSRGTRTIAEAVDHIRDNTATDRWDLFSSMAELAGGFNEGELYPPIFLVGDTLEPTDRDHPLVIFEGSTRSTAWFLAERPQQMPSGILGISPNMGQWPLF